MADATEKQKRGPRRSKAHRERDLERIAALYLRNVRQSEIAAEIGITQQQVSYDLKTLQERWKKSALVSLDEAKRIHLAKIDELERWYWQAWMDSRRPRTETSSGSVGDTKRAQVKQVERDGNPAFLAGVMNCLEQRAKILGLYAPEKREHSGPGGKPISMQSESKVDLNVLSVEQLKALKGMIRAVRGAGNESKSG